MSDRKKEQAVEGALTEGYEKYYRLAYSYVHNEADALDIVQEAAYKAILKSDSLKEPQYVETWVYRIVVNEACSFLRNRKESADVEEIQAAKDAGPEALQALMLPVESVFESLPLLVAEPRVEQHLYNGCPTSRYPAADGRYRVRNAEGQFLGLANITGGVLKVEKLFVERN